MQEKKRIHAFLFVTALIFLVYSNTFQSSWQVDDEQNIFLNSNLHLSELTVEQISRTIRAHPSGKVYRPLSCLTFALNWYFGEDNVWGYHVVNTAIHILTAWILFLTLRLLLQIHYQEKNSQLIDAAALLGALFWALSPIQTQAVTYIVQRMASMAAMFSIFGIYAYLRGRYAVVQRKKYLWVALCLFSFCAALGSKENAILLPASLILVEAAFFRHHFSKKNIIFFIFVAIVAFSTVFFLVRSESNIFSLNKLFGFINEYAGRSFTLKERVLTEPRILLLYLSQILIPNVAKLSIEHDVVLSTSFFSPWTTLPAIIFILFIILTSLFFLKKYPLFCFPVLFFFLNHSVESTIVPLELVFEHRNYLPSLFLFLPVGTFVSNILYNTPPQLTFRRISTAFCIIFSLVIFGHATYTRNQAWATAGSLWTDAIRKAPKSSRAAHNLGVWYRQFGQYRAAYYYFQRALQHAEKSPTPVTTKELALNGLGSVSYVLGNYEQSLIFFDQCLDVDEKSEVCLENQALAYLYLDFPEKALFTARKLLHEHPTSVSYQYLSALSAYKIGDIDSALQWMQKIVKQSLNNHEGMYLTGILLIKKGAVQNSLFFLERAVHLSPNTIKDQFALAAAYYASGQTSLTENIIKDALQNHSLSAAIDALQILKKNNEIDESILDHVEDIFQISIKNLLRLNTK